MTCARINDDEWSANRIGLDAVWRNDADEHIVHRPLQGTTVDDNFECITQDVRRELGGLLAILIAAFAQHVPKQNSALRRVDHIVNGGRQGAKCLG
jgi:hypothetical protein